MYLNTTVEDLQEIARICDDRRFYLYYTPKLGLTVRERIAEIRRLQAEICEINDIILRLGGDIVLPKPLNIELLNIIS